MLDIRTIRDDPQRVKAAGRKKLFVVDAEVDRILDLDGQRRELLHEMEQLKAEQNRASKAIARLEGEEKQERIKEMQVYSRKTGELKASLSTIQDEFDELILRLPNLPDEDVPDGETAEDNVSIREWGEVPEFDFEFKDHLALGQELDLIDISRATRLAGSRTYILKNDGALMELAVLQFAVNFLVEKGFSPMIVPTLVRRDPLVGTAYFPGGEEQSYACERDSLYLIGTSEVPVTAYHGGEILDASELPKLYCGYSTCYRREAGAAGKDTRGLYRIHQFNKVEQVVVCRGDEEESRRFHQLILENAEAIVQALELPYRVVNVCGGDLGLPQVQKFDIETWMPSRASYGETHSASRFYDFQARRLGLRYRDEGGKVRFCHTLNNTAIASPRILIALLEVHQQADGSVAIPEALRPYLGGRTHIRKRKI